MVVPRRYPAPLMWWLVPATVVMFACAATSIPFGVWVLATSRWPSWMRGRLIWPLGDRMSHRVVVLQGWSYVLIGAASLLMTLLLLVLPALIADTAVPVRWIVGVVLVFVVALLTSGTIPYIRSVRMSRGPAAN